MTHHPPVKPFGLTQVYAPPRGEIPTVDIVFVHGLNGHPENSWTSKTSGCFWPVDLLPDVLAQLRPRILTYGYNANVAAFTDGASRDSIVSHAETLASNLAANRNLRSCSDRPIIFVCHSLGGLVVKRALIYSRSLSNEKTEHLRSVYVSTFGILFLGTPHNGSDVAKWGLLLHKICTAVLPKKVMEGSPQLIKALQTNNETLQHINSLFADIMSRFHIYLFHETRSMDVRGTREIIVDEASAAPYFEGVERGGIEADHSHMCKFDDENSSGYEVVAEAILRYSREAPSVIADRWIEERKTRILEKKAKAREIYDGADDPVGQSMPNLNTPATGQLVPILPRGSATNGRNSPVSDPSKTNIGPLSRSLNSLPSQSQKEPALFVAPPGFHPNAAFFGMQKELEELHRRLFKAKARAERTMAVLIAGVPGSGKTQLARQYVFTQRECYTGGVFWIDAKSRESVYKCFWEIAQAATLVDHKEAEDSKHQESRTYVNAVRNWLQSRNEWLLIFDGITFDHDDDINDFRPFLPWNKRCSIIYTSIDATLRKKQRLFEPYCLTVPRLKVEDACRLLYKDLGIRRPTPDQASKATELVEHYECLPLAIHAIGHRLNATGKPIERYHVKHQVTDKKLAEPFLCIMNDLYRLKHREALNLINLLSFLGHHVPVGLLVLGRSIMTVENAEILSSAQSGEDPDLDTTLGTLIHYGLVERTSDADVFQHNGSAKNSNDEMHDEQKKTPQLTDSFTESSQDGFFSIYRGNSLVDVVKVHSVVQGFCRDELKIKDEEYKDLNQAPGFYDSWLIVATRFLCKSYEMAMERMAHYHDCGLVRDYREYETHASRLAELFPKKLAIGNHPHVIREARESLRQLMKSISSEIDRMSPSSSQESARNQKSVFDRSSSSSSSFPDSSADEGGLSRQSTWNWTESGSARAESPEQMMGPPRFKLELFPPHIFPQAGSESEDGYETDGEAKEAPRISPALSQMSQVTERPKQSPPSSSPPIPREDAHDWQLVERYFKTRSAGPRQQSKRPRGPSRFRGARPDTPLVKVSPIEGRGSSSRMSSGPSESSSILSSAAEAALAAVRRISGHQTSSNSEDVSSSSSNKPLSSNKENVPTYASIAAKRILEANEAQLRRPASMPAPSGPVVSSGLQMKPSVESLDSQASRVFASPLSHEVMSHELMSHEIIAEPLTRSTYSDPGRDYLEHSLGTLDLHTAPTSQVNSRRPSVQANIEPVIRDLSASTPVFPYGIPIRELSASTPSLQYPPPLPYDQDITITIPHRRSVPQRAPEPIFSSSMAPKHVPVAHPSAIMPGALPLSATSSNSTVIAAERPGGEALSRGSSGFSHQSWATEPVRSPPRFSPATSFAQPTDITRSPTPLHQNQHVISTGGSWPLDQPLSSSASAIQSDNLYLPQTRGRLGSVDERLRNMDLSWNSEIAAQDLRFGGHRVDVRDARQRLQEVGRLQTPRHMPTYQLYHSNMSGPLVHDDGHIYAPALALEVYGMRARSGSSPPRPNYNGLGVQFNDHVFD
ncbi:Putative LipA and NB-ARC domain protein [Penicillium brasilianum]|uniref:Putative LipA and NB-ARC domain protein n=1 Tax=Penicillium brasilianum TaxID=104259 RepID=A0A0F7TIK9_PENBI|nr:Putative LipA and NB-ARC domain protein [Penicillium brasilianum]